VKRGDIVTVALSGDYGKPRPALVIQADAFRDLASVTVLRLTSELHNWPTFRVTADPTPENGLRFPSQIMIDKAVAIPRDKVGRPLGRLDDAMMRAVDRALLVFLGLG
jgi:mRNA interferase MazF